MKNLVNMFIVCVLLLSALAVMPAAAQDSAAVVIGTNAEYPPFESVDESGAIVGFDIDLIKAIAEDAGLEVEFVNTKWDGIFVALAEGEFDAVISAATITEEREEIVDFTDPYFNAGQMIAVGAALAETVSTPEDLAGLRVGVQLGTTGDEYAGAIEGAEVVRFDEITLAFQALGAGEVDAIINDGPVSADIIANNPDLEAVLVGEPLTDEFYGIAVNPERSDLLDAFNTSLANLIADGTYAEIYTQWFAQEPPSAFRPAEETTEGGEGGEMAVDYTDPTAVTLALLSTFFAAESAEDLLAFACEGAAESPLFPDDDTLAGFAGMSLADASNLTLESVIQEDGSAYVTATEGSTITLKIGEAEQEMPIALLLMQLGISGVRLEQDADGNWKVCPEPAE
jgi:ABC-type amino acid transport substrate-binding protein